MHRASAVTPSPKWVLTEDIVRQKSSRAKASRGDYLNQTSIGLLNQTSIGLAVSVSPEATQKTRLRQKTSPQLSLAPIFERLKELAQLKADWDSYGAEPVSSVALVATFELLDAVKERLSRKVRESLPQFIAPLADGGLQLEWKGQRGDIEVKIDPIGNFSYVLLEGQETNRKFQEKARASLEEVLKLLSEFLILSLKDLSFQSGTLQASSLMSPKPQSTTQALYPLRGTPIRYENPTEPVAEEDWSALG